MQIECAMVETLKQIDNEYGKIENSQDSGSTAVVVLLSHLLICVSNVGEFF